MKKTVYWIVCVTAIAAGIISCKKDPSASLEISIATDNVYHPNATVNVKEIWLNYSTKKSKSEWVKLDLLASSYDLGDLYSDQRDTIIVAATSIDKIETLLQLRFTFSEQNNSVITSAEDTLDMSMSNPALSGIQIGLNKSVESGKTYDLRLAIKADSTLIHQSSPVFDPTIRVDSLKIKN